MKTCPKCEKEFDDTAPDFCPDDGARLVNIPSGQAPPDPLIGQLLTDRIRIDSKIGEGGMGAVYKGEDVQLGRTVAIKVMHATLKHSGEDVRRFLQEARIVARLRHPNTIQVFDFGESKTGHYYIAMEYMTGEPLDQYFERNRPTLGRIFEIVEQVCLSLEEAHAAGIVHRDLKPENIFIDTVNNRRLVKVIDFGIAKLVEGGENLTQQGMVFGTPAYMSPEQARGEKLDARSDVYALGCVMFAMLTGRPPFVGDSAMDVAIQHLTQPAPEMQALSRFGALPPKLIELVGSMLAKDRTKRPQSVSEVRQRVLEIARSTPDVRFDAPGNSGAMLKIRTEPTAAQPPPQATQLANRTSTGEAARVARADDEMTTRMPVRRRTPWVVAGALAVLAAVVAAALVLGRNPTPQAATGASETASATPAPIDTQTNVDVMAAAPAADVPAAVDAAMQPLPQALARAVMAAQQASVSVSVSSNPAGATVTRIDTAAVIGTTPFSWTTRVGSDAVGLRVELEGYEATDASVVPTAGAAVAVELERSSSASSRRDREPRPTEAEPDEPTGEGGNAASGETPGGNTTNSGGLELRRPVTIPTE